MRFTSYGFALADCQPEDDIDQIFSLLPQVEPPGELISRIIAHIGHLPLSSVGPWPRQHSEQNPPSEGGLENLIVHNEKQEPS